MKVVWGDPSIDEREMCKVINLRLDFLEDSEEDGGEILEDAEKRRSWGPLQFMMRFWEKLAFKPETYEYQQ